MTSHVKSILRSTNGRECTCGEQKRQKKKKNEREKKKRKAHDEEPKSRKEDFCVESRVNVKKKNTRYANSRGQRDRDRMKIMKKEINKMFSSIPIKYACYMRIGMFDKLSFK